jgi:hypothetical protein
MPEQYQVYFNSRSSNAIQDATLGLNKVTYLMNWGSFLPKKYKRFLCQFIFKSENYSATDGTTLTDNGFVNLSMGNTYTFDGSTRSNNIGIIYPVITTYSATNTSSFYNSTNNDNNQFYMDYPLSNSVVITLNRYDGTIMRNMPNYTIFLNLVGVSEEDDKNDNF